MPTLPPTEVVLGCSLGNTAFRELVAYVMEARNLGNGIHLVRKSAGICSSLTCLMDYSDWGEC